MDVPAATRTDAEKVRFRAIAAILARGVGRVRRAADLLPSDEPVFDNLADSLPERLEIAGERPLSVSHDVSDRAERDETPNDSEHGETF
ncbi:hypothetical protein [Rubripirellula amarantea]|uniref:hypothetical protein n=1 Tax=Rubripirellula amarantea TaxID=2527999 RepID=UPI0011B85A8D|nr:hypothetical protein [Rubripirellula amarantea]